MGSYIDLGLIVFSEVFLGMDEQAKKAAEHWDFERPAQLSENYVGGFYKVMFGWRYRVVNKFDFMGSQLEWCLGVNEMAHVIYPMFLLRVSEKGGDEVIEKLPRYSDPKPVWNDEKFHEEINMIAVECGAPTLPPELVQVIQVQ